MRRLLVSSLVFAVLMAGCGSALAGQAEVRDVAISNNCPPKKIEVYQQTLGETGSTIYRIQCTMPKTVGTPDNTDNKPPDTLLVSCKQNLCEMLRAESMDKK